MYLCFALFHLKLPSCLQMDFPFSYHCMFTTLFSVKLNTLYQGRPKECHAFCTSGMRAGSQMKLTTRWRRTLNAQVRRFEYCTDTALGGAY